MEAYFVIDNSLAHLSVLSQDLIEKDQKVGGEQNNLFARRQLLSSQSHRHACPRTSKHRPSPSESTHGKYRPYRDLRYAASS